MKKIVVGTFLLTLGLTTGALLAANKFGAPKSIVHVVTILWKEDSTPQQQQAALEGVKKMAGEIPGIKNVWIKSTKVQGRAAPGKDGKPGRPMSNGTRPTCRSARKALRIRSPIKAICEIIATLENFMRMKTLLPAAL